MIYLSGIVDKLPMGIGYMMTPYVGNRPPMEGRWWAADTGCFTKPYDRNRYTNWLSTMSEHTEGNLFITAPDKVGDWVTTLELFEREASILREFDFPLALVAQDGLTPEFVPWNEIDALFIGGSTEFKLGDQARELCLTARRFGIWVHMGRVNSYKRMKLAKSWGCDSVDGTYLAYRRRGPGYNGEQDILNWLERLEAEG